MNADGSVANTIDYGYNAASNLLSTIDDFSAFAFTYDDRDRVKTVDNAGTPGAPNVVLNYTYDDRDQLIGADHGDPNNPDESYTYDANGNRIVSHLHGNGYVTGPANRLLSDGTFNYEYDDEGNRVRQATIATGDVREFEYDHRNRLVAVIDKNSVGTETQRVGFTYDAFGRRISKHLTDAVDDVITIFVYDREDVILDFVDADGAGGTDPTVDKRYLHGPAIDQVLAQEDGAAGVQWHIADHLVTVGDLVDETGGALNHITYDSYGNVVSESESSVGSRYRYTGREFEAAFGGTYPISLSMSGTRQVKTRTITDLSSG